MTEEEHGKLQSRGLTTSKGSVRAKFRTSTSAYVFSLPEKIFPLLFTWHFVECSPKLLWKSVAGSTLQFFRPVKCKTKFNGLLFFIEQRQTVNATTAVHLLDWSISSRFIEFVNVYSAFCSACQNYPWMRLTHYEDILHARGSRNNTNVEVNLLLLVKIEV